MKKFKIYLILFLLFFIYIFFSVISYSKAVCSDISDSVFRLHVIANSNSSEDQNLKYIVRNSILEYFNKITQNASSKEEVICIIKNNIDKIKEIAQTTVYKNGYNYKIRIEIGNFKFPTKTYGNITFPPGYYDALKIKIGNAEGKNWWCVLFPPLCFVDTTSGIVPEESKEFLESNLSKEEYHLISENSNNVKIKFKVVEVLQNLNISGIFM